MTTMNDLMLIKPVADATPRQTQESVMTWLRNACPDIFDEAVMNPVAMGRVMDSVSCKVVIDGTISGSGPLLLRMDYGCSTVAFVSVRTVPRGLSYGYQVMALQEGSTDVLLYGVRSALLRPNNCTLKRAYLHDDVSEFLGELVPA